MSGQKEKIPVNLDILQNPVYNAVKISGGEICSRR
jgi:hypothetical protein